MRDRRFSLGAIAGVVALSLSRVGRRHPRALSLWRALSLCVPSSLSARYRLVLQGELTDGERSDFHDSDHDDEGATDVEMIVHVKASVAPLTEETLIPVSPMT